MRVEPNTIPLGYRMPAEWEKHEATWLAWPHNPETWVDLDEIEKLYVDIIGFLTQGEKVNILVNDKREEEKVAAKLSRNRIKPSQVHYFQIKTHDAWIRDYGPNFIVERSGAGSGKLAVNRWIFNAWGDKYEEHREDDQASQALTFSLDVPVFEPNIVLEGGAIDGNGEGTLLVTEECLLNPNRNPHLDKNGIEGCLKNYLGARHIVWLHSGIFGDDTDGHVDAVARFVSQNTVVAAVENNPKDENFDSLQENLKRLKKAKDQNGKKLNVVEFPMPEPLLADSQRLPASYANFYIANSVVLVPVFGQPSDQTALRIMKELFPNRSIIGVRSDLLVYGLGGIHCITHEQPATASPSHTSH